MPFARGAPRELRQAAGAPGARSGQRGPPVGDSRRVHPV